MARSKSSFVVPASAGIGLPEGGTTNMLIRSQRLFLLRDDVDARQALRAQNFRGTRPDGKPDKEDELFVPDELAWEPISRDALNTGQFGDRPLDHVVMVTDAGNGKSTNLEIIQYDVTKLDQAWAPIIPVGSLTTAAEFPEQLWKLFSEQWEKLPTTAKANLDEERVKANLVRLQSRRRLTLLFDGLEQAGTDSINALAAILDTRWSQCRIVIAARPFALEHYWSDLFDGDSWRFVYLSEFDPRQQRLCLGKLSDGSDRYDKILREARPILRSPRVIEYLRDAVPERELSEIKTVSDVYWRSTCYMLTQALGSNVNVFSIQRYLALLGALAFTMYAQTNRDEDTGALRPNLDRVAALDIHQFLKTVHARVKRALDLGHDGESYRLEYEFLDDLRKLTQLNGAIDHGFLDMLDVAATDANLLWRNASLQEFLAAYWAVRWADASELAPLRKWMVDPLVQTTHGFYWFWRYATEMPAKAVLPGSTATPTAYIETMRCLYELPETDDPPIRSTEFVYRSWDQMADWAPKVIETFQSEFGQILKGDRAGRDANGKQVIAKQIVDGLIPLCEGVLPDDTGTFIMGAPVDEDPEMDSKDGEQDNPRHEVKLSKFLMHETCVTNMQYELFDARHANHRWYDHELEDYRVVHSKATHPEVKEISRASADDDCPVVMVSWYDVWCFCKWLSGVTADSGQLIEFRLPTEAEWEYACRAGQETPFNFGKGQNGKSCTSEICNFAANFPWPAGAAKGKYRERTISVKELPANRWGFYQMHGNVWEWCLDWYDAGFYNLASGVDPRNEVLAWARVNRGGSWFGFARFCRPAYRGRNAPRFRFVIYGFRLAAVPRSSSSK